MYWQGQTRSRLWRTATSRSLLSVPSICRPSSLQRHWSMPGCKGGTPRLAACETGICAPGNSFAQNLANELKALGAESAVIAPTANVQIVGGKHGLPQMQPPTPPGGQKPPLLPPGEGWEYVVAEERLGWQVERSAFKPGAWKGSAGGAVKLGLMMGLSYLHGEAVAKRVEKETAETGFSEPGPTGSLGVRPRRLDP